MHLVSWKRYKYSIHALTSKSFKLGKKHQFWNIKLAKSKIPVWKSISIRALCFNLTRQNSGNSGRKNSRLHLLNITSTNESRKYGSSTDVVFPKQFVLANLSPLLQNDRLKAWLSRFKRQWISEWLFGVFYFQKTNAKMNL